MAILRNIMSMPALFLVPKGGFVKVTSTKGKEQGRNVSDSFETSILINSKTFSNLSASSTVDNCFSRSTESKSSSDFE